MSGTRTELTSPQVDDSPAPLQFTQMFTLNPENGSFYVFNDIFRYVSAACPWARADITSGSCTAERCDRMLYLACKSTMRPSNCGL